MIELNLSAMDEPIFATRFPLCNVQRLAYSSTSVMYMLHARRLGNLIHFQGIPADLATKNLR